MKLIVFDMTHAALAAESALTKAGIPAGLAPTPAKISAGCGFCVTVAPEDENRARAALTDCGIVYSGVYETVLK